MIKNLSLNNNKTIIFDQTKNSIFTIKDELRILSRRLKAAGFKVMSNKENITYEIISQACIYVFIAPQIKFTQEELNTLKKYLDNNGVLWILLGEGGEKKLCANINIFLKNYGISINNDSVVRTYYYKYFHPKEVLIHNGILNRNIFHESIKLKKNINENSFKKIKNDIFKDNENNENNENNETNENELIFLYPFGATLNIESPSIALLSTGSVSFPINRPVCGFYYKPKKNGRILVIGTSMMFTNNYIEKEDNFLLLNVFLHYSLQDDVQLNIIDAENPEIADYHFISTISFLSEQPMPYYQESEKIGSDFFKLIFEDSNSLSIHSNTFDYEKKKLFQLDNSVYLLILNYYNKLQIKNEQLTLIKPAFETPLPSLEPATFPPSFRCYSKPALELYDLDDEFCTIQNRLIQLSNKCTDKDLNYFIKKAGKLLNIVDANTRTSKEILERIFKKIIQFKKVN